MLAAFFARLLMRVSAGKRARMNNFWFEVLDLLVHKEGTLFLFCPLTARAKAWIYEHVAEDAHWFGAALVVEHRYALGLAQGMKDTGLLLW
jgi:hypothetical protein